MLEHTSTVLVLEYRVPNSNDTGVYTRVIYHLKKLKHELTKVAGVVQPHIHVLRKFSSTYVRLNEVGHSGNAPLDLFF